MQRGLEDLLKWKERVENEIIKERRNVYYDVLDGEINIMFRCGRKKCELRSFGRGPPKNAEEAYFRGRYVKVPGDVIHKDNTTYCLGRVLGFMSNSDTLYEVRFKLNTWLLKKEDFEPYLVDVTHEVLDEIWLDDHDMFCAKCNKTSSKSKSNNMFVRVVFHLIHHKKNIHPIQTGTMRFLLSSLSRIMSSVLRSTCISNVVL